VTALGVLAEDIPSCALAIYAHPDDPDISCGGTLAKWAAAGCPVHVVLCTLGDKGSRQASVEPSVLARCRLDEARRSSEVLGVTELHRLERRDGEIENDLSIREELVRLLRLLRPDTVICPDPTAVFYGSHHYNHRDHRVVGYAALDAVSPAAASPLYFPAGGQAHEVSEVLMSGSLEPNAWVDVTETIDLKVRAVACHESQLQDPSDWLSEALRERAAEAGRRAGVSFAEGFRRLQLR
jgi:LmbE family N-acetylglucosaminyl deacetylase